MTGNLLPNSLRNHTYREAVAGNLTDRDLQDPKLNRSVIPML